MTNAAITLAQKFEKQRRAVFSQEPSVLTEIYQDDVNFAVWQNPLSADTKQEIDAIMASAQHLKAVMTVTPDNVVSCLADHSEVLSDKKAFNQHIAVLVDMFCTLFELKRVGLRLNFIDSAMCPKFHVDHVPCRLITTFSGIATEWLPHDRVDRSRLGAASVGMPDESAGIMQSTADIQHLNTGDVALAKGEGWFDNENGGLVHRSPQPLAGEHRLVMTLDFID